MIILNFSHPLTNQQTAQIETLTGQTISEIRDILTQLDNMQPFPEQIRELVDSLHLTSDEWQRRAPFLSTRRGMPLHHSF